MEDLTLLDKFKKYLQIENTDSAFKNIYKDINNIFIQKDVPESINNEIIDLGDFCFQEHDNISKEDTNAQKVLLFDLYKKIKQLVSGDKIFFNECTDILCSLNIEQVRELESLSECISSIEGSKILRISYNDGIVFNYEINKDYFKDKKNILKFKSFLARCIKLDGIIIVEFIDTIKKEFKVSGFLFKDSKWYSLKKQFVKKIHKSSTNNKIQYISITKK